MLTKVERGIIKLLGLCLITFGLCTVFSSCAEESVSPCETLKIKGSYWIDANATQVIHFNLDSTDLYEVNNFGESAALLGNRVQFLPADISWDRVHVTCLGTFKLRKDGFLYLDGQRWIPFEF